MAERGRVKQLGRKAAPAEAQAPEAKVTFAPRFIEVLFVGGITACNDAMRERGVNPAELGRSWAIAYNGPQHFQRPGQEFPGPVEILYQEEHEPTGWEHLTIAVARTVSGTPRTGAL